MYCRYKISLVQEGQAPHYGGDWIELGWMGQTIIECQSTSLWMYLQRVKEDLVQGFMHMDNALDLQTFWDTFFSYVKTWGVNCFSTFFIKCKM